MFSNCNHHSSTRLCAAMRRTPVDLFSSHRHILLCEEMRMSSPKKNLQAKSDRPLTQLGVPFGTLLEEEQGGTRAKHRGARALSGNNGQQRSFPEHKLGGYATRPSRKNFQERGVANPTDKNTRGYTGTMHKKMETLGAFKGIYKGKVLRS